MRDVAKNQLRGTMKRFGKRTLTFSRSGGSQYEVLTLYIISQVLQRLYFANKILCYIIRLWYCNNH